jgi:hypothetical protein
MDGGPRPPGLLDDGEEVLGVLAGAASGGKDQVVGGALALEPEVGERHFMEQNGASALLRPLFSILGEEDRGVTDPEGDRERERLGDAKRREVGKPEMIGGADGRAIPRLPFDRAGGGQQLLRGATRRREAEKDKDEADRPDRERGDAEIERKGERPRAPASRNGPAWRIGPGAPRRRAVLRSAKG